LNREKRKEKKRKEEKKMQYMAFCGK